MPEICQFIRAGPQLTGQHAAICVEKLENIRLISCFSIDINENFILFLPFTAKLIAIDLAARICGDKSKPRGKHGELRA